MCTGSDKHARLELLVAHTERLRYTHDTQAGACSSRIKATLKSVSKDLHAIQMGLIEDKRKQSDLGNRVCIVI